MKYITDEQYNIAMKNGVKKSTVYSRVYLYKWDVEKAINTPVITREYRSRKYPKKYTDLALSNGMSIVTFYNRVKSGWSYKKAATEPLLRKKKTKRERKSLIYG